MGLKTALKALDEAVKDLTSLQVQTFTGDIKSNIDGTKGFKDIRKLVQTARNEGKAKLVAETLAQFDGDSYNFITSDSDDVPQAAYIIHKNAVDSGIETRLGLLELFKDVIGLD